MAADHTTYTGEPGTILVKTDVEGNVYTTNSDGEQIDCPCEATTKAKMIDTYATISDMLDHTSVSNHEVSIDWTETSPVDLGVPVGAICN